MATLPRPIDVRALAQLLMAGKTLRQAAAALGLKTDKVFRLAVANELHRRRRALPRKLRRKVERLLTRATLSQSAIAREVGIAKSTVSRWKGRPRLAPIVGVGQVIRLRTARRCPQGHKTTVWPCLQCALAVDRKAIRPRQ